MDTAQTYAQRLEEIGGYKKKILAFKLCDGVPEGVAFYGDDISFLCAIAAEAWEEERRPFYITNRNIICGGALYAGLGVKKMSREDIDLGLSMAIGVNHSYSTRQAMRRVNQQLPHHFRHHNYQIIGTLEDVDNPDVVMIATDIRRMTRLCKAYTWKTGELVHGIAGTSWCATAFPLVYRTRTMTYVMGDPPSRRMMNLEADELCCFVHYDLLPLIVENLPNISESDEL